jgi:hypothetical protein
MIGAHANYLGRILAKAQATKPIPRYKEVPMSRVKLPRPRT